MHYAFIRDFRRVWQRYAEGTPGRFDSMRSERERPDSRWQCAVNRYRDVERLHVIDRLPILVARTNLTGACMLAA
jgi:hypothetical protein